MFKMLSTAQKGTATVAMHRLPHVSYDVCLSAQAFSSLAGVKEVTYTTLVWLFVN